MALFLEFRSLFAGSLVALSVGCAAPRAPYRTPDHWTLNDHAWADDGGSQEKPSYQGGRAPLSAKTHPDDLSSEVDAQATTLSFVSNVPTPSPTHAPVARGEACHLALRERGVSFTPLADLVGVENPIEVRGMLGSVSYFSSDKRPLILDCRLAVALSDLGPVWSAHGVTRVRFSGAYSYRTTKSGRLSHHALGLAIDIHEIFVGGRSLSVTTDFARNVGCQPGAPELNAVSCALRQTRFFEEFLTPDFNRDHYDHLHISVPRRVRPNPL